MARKKQSELEIEGVGAAPVSLPDIDRLAEDYIKERDKRIAQTPKEVAAKRKLIDALHDNADRIRSPDGHLIYRYDEMKIILIPGKEKLKVEEITLEED